MKKIRQLIVSKIRNKLILTTTLMTTLALVIVSAYVIWSAPVAWQPVILVATGALVLSVGITVGLSRNITQPLVELNQAVRRASWGDFTTEIVPTTNDEIGNLALSFNAMARQLQSLMVSLEERVDERTRALEAIALISRQITTILDIDQLMQEVVNRVQQTFDYYHVHIYLINPDSGALVMREGTGEVGRRLKNEKHKLHIGQGIVGRVAETGEAYLAKNVADVPHFFRNPLLPKTQAELAVPLRKGKQVLGVLDLQSDKIDGFSEQELLLMQAVADQVAVAIDNARLFRQLQQTLQDSQELGRQLLRENWQHIDQQVPNGGFMLTKTGLTPAPAVWESALARAAHQRQLIQDGDHAVDGKVNLAVPLKLRDEVIGVIGLERVGDKPWSDDELVTVQTVSDQIARALENARLSQEQEKTIEQLKEIDRLKSEFLTSMSHELRTPLNSIIGFSDVLLQGIDGDLNELAMHDIQLIYNSGQHLLALINDILDLSKIEAEKMELIIESISLPEIVKEVVAASNSLLKNKPVEMIVDIAESLPLIQADKLRLTQVLLNLVSNAAKFTDQGSITIKAAVRSEAPDYARIAVIDTGIGVPQEKQVAIFDRFRQADSSTTRRYGGTGLGLAICRKLVELHGGEIGVISEAGQGAEFFFTLPVSSTSRAD